MLSVCKCMVSFHQLYKTSQMKWMENLPFELVSWFLSNWICFSKKLSQSAELTEPDQLFLVPPAHSLWVILSVISPVSFIRQMVKPLLDHLRKRRISFRQGRETFFLKKIFFSFWLQRAKLSMLVNRWSLCVYYQL